MQDKFRLKGRVAVITGAANRLGFELAQNISREGVGIAIVDIDREKGERAAEAIRKEGGDAEIFFADICSQESVSEMVHNVVSHYKRIDLLVNGAKSYSHPPKPEEELQNWDQSLKVILTGAFNCSQKIIPTMESGGGGSIINISSIASNFVCEQSIGYHVAKSGLDQLTRYLAFHNGPRGIRVNGISPGLIIKKENISQYEEDADWKNRWEWCHPLKQPGFSEDISNVILFLASNQAKFITGQTLIVDGGLTLSDPGFLVDKFYKEMKI